MIFKYDRRLTDGCDTCGNSATFCAANRDTNRQPCCNRCTH